MSTIRVGTSGWAYKSWQPAFYPPKLSSTKFLSFYSSQLSCVEVNYTFRAKPAATTLQNWAAATPDEFRFTAKAHQRITHIKRLNEVEQEIENFYASLQPLMHARKLGPVLFQLPPNLKADVDRLSRFLSALPKPSHAAMEFRNESWFKDEVFDLMRQHDVALCIAESDDLQSPEIHTASFAYYRLRRSDYSEDELAQIADRLRKAAEGRDVYAFMKHEERPDGALNARKLLQMLSAAQ